MTKVEKSGSTSAKVLYKPVGLAGSLIAGAIAGKIFDQVWKKAAPGPEHEPPGSLETGYPLKEIVAAAALQGAIFAVVRTLVARGGARAFQRATGEWPGD
ncbi:DUF4235 domain-containing protein [Demequina flava]|uniref:DUF4235 domain-containing protein n=1 Tax=Demequina flava TaxID=1095025 RepID=UPI00078571BA|nr:DUF4235 domain-containing protein [Demequina flava]